MKRPNEGDIHVVVDVAPPGCRYRIPERLAG